MVIGLAKGPIQSNTWFRVIRTTHFMARRVDGEISQSILYKPMSCSYRCVKPLKIFLLIKDVVNRPEWTLCLKNVKMKRRIKGKRCWNCMIIDRCYWVVLLCDCVLANPLRLLIIVALIVKEAGLKPFIYLINLTDQDDLPGRMLILYLMSWSVFLEDLSLQICSNH